MTPDQLQKLAAELSQDPTNLGYAAMVAIGNDDGIATLLNTTPAIIAVATVSKNDFLKATAGAAVRLALGVGTDGQPFASAVTAPKWKALLDHSYAADPGSQIDLSVLPALGDPVAEKVLTAAEYGAMATRTGTRAELVCGVANVSHTNVAFALRG